MSREGVLLRKTAAGRLVRGSMKKDGVQLSIRLEPELAERFAASVVIEAAVYGNDPVASRVLRSLIRQYCDRIQTINESPEAKQAAKVMRRKVGA